MEELIFLNYSTLKTMADDFYCEICRRSDSRGAKHVYTQKHKEKIKIILRKFEDKVY